MRYVIEMETTKELNRTSELLDFLQWFLKSIAGIGKSELKSIGVRRCGE